jgi:hypothetical protein
LLSRVKNARLFSASGEIFGVALRLEADSEATLGNMSNATHLGLEVETGAEQTFFRIAQAGRNAYKLESGGGVLSEGDYEHVLEHFERQLRRYVAFNAPHHVFVHAGTVAHDGHALVIPGPSFSGKTSLVAALVSAGAAYYSDEYAVFDATGLVYPYAKPLAIRLNEGSPVQTHHSADQLGGAPGTEPVRLGLVVCSQYRRDAVWKPAELSPAQTLLELFGHSYGSADRPAQTMDTLRQAITTTTGLKGDRGEAAAIAAELLTRLSSSAG